MGKGSIGAQWLRICLQWRRPGFEPWVGKIPWRREWQPTSLFLHGEFHRQRSLAGYSAWSHKQSDRLSDWTKTVLWAPAVFWSSVQFSSVAQLCPTLCDPMNRSTPRLPVHHQLLEFTQTHVHWVGDAIQPSHLLSSPSPPAFNLSQHPGLFQWVSSLLPVAKGLEFQLQHQSFQWMPRTGILLDGLVGSPCSSRGLQDSSPTPQFKSINSDHGSFFIWGPSLCFHLEFFLSFFHPAISLTKREPARGNMSGSWQNLLCIKEKKKNT